MKNYMYKPNFHFCNDFDNGYPGDANGCFFVDGVYHFMMLYKNSQTNGFHWAHFASRDLINWERYEDALTVFEGDEGCYSGGAFVDEDKRAYLAFWRLFKHHGRSNISIAFSDPPYKKWERMENPILEDTEWGITDVEINGKTVHLACADPSNIWKMNGYYYVQLGNLCTLNKYGKIENPDPYYVSGWTELFRSKDLKNWEFVHRFYENNISGPDWPEAYEDDMCPSFLPLYDTAENGKFTGKYLQLFISHTKGCQYFIGELQGEKFIPETHGRMTWKDSHFFAPEALVDDKKRHIMWVWFRENPDESFERFGWSGLYSSPRMLWLEENELKMAPVKELEELQFNHQLFDTLKDNRLKLNNGKTCRINVTFNAINSKNGLKVRISEDGSEYTEIYYDKEIGKLVFDSSNSGNYGWKIKEEAPFDLRENENLKFDILIDNSIIEVYANNRQAIGRCVFPTDPETATGVEIIGDAACVEKLESWEMKAINVE